MSDSERSGRSPATSIDAISAATEACVRCGLCLPHCPTYGVRREEAQGPRGRVLLAAALARGAATTLDAERALDDCLSCGACTAVCPAGVRVVPAISAARTLLPRRSRLPLRRRVVFAIARRPALLRGLLRMRFLLRGPARRLLARWLGKGAVSLARAMPDAALAQRPVGYTPARGARRGEIVLWTGCATGVAEGDTQVAATSVLAQLGYDVHVEATPHCCGALDVHAGEPDAADARARALASLAARWPDAHHLQLSSGCSVGFARALVGRPVDELTSFLAREAALSPPPRPLRAALMVPCTHRHDLGSEALRRVLGRIPRLEVIELDASPRCCGAAGLYAVDHEAIAEPLRDASVARILALAPDVVLTTNAACRVQLLAGLRAAGSGLDVIHPVRLLEREAA